jgi:PEP-CTERM motif
MRKVMLAVVLCLLATVVAQAGIPITVVNPGFELPALALEAKIKGFDGDRDGFMGAEFDVPGWQDDCISGSANHSGIKNEGGQRAVTGQGAHLSDLATEIANENIVWQLTDQVIAAGDVYTLSVWGWSDGGSGGVGLDVSLFYGDGQTELNSADYLLADGDEVGIACPVTFTILDGHESIGEQIGVKFENTTLTGFAHLDDASLTVVPEPATMVLLGLGSLAMLKRRRA